MTQKVSARIMPEFSEKVNDSLHSEADFGNGSLFGYPILDYVKSAIVLHDWPQDFLSQNVVCVMAPDADFGAETVWPCGTKKGWQRVDMTIATLRTAFADPTIAKKKGGNIFSPCELTGRARKKENVVAIYAMTFDVDNGQTEEDLIQKLEAFGACYVTYTSHSNGKASDSVPLKKLHAFDPEISDDPTDDDLRRFLAAPRHKESSGNEGVGLGYWPALVASAKITKAEDGMVHFEHDPMTKLRIVIPLAQPFLIDQSSPAARVRSERQWKAAYIHIANKIGVAYDHSCTDTTRAFYSARAKSLDNYRSIIGGTTPFVFPEVTPEMLKEAGLSFRSGNKVKKAVERPHAEGMPDFDDLMRRHGSEFDASGYLDALGWEMKGQPDISRKTVIECPNDNSHTSAHWPNDTGCVVMPPDVADSGKATIVCQHDGCKQRAFSTADYLGMIWQRQNESLAEGSEPLPAPEDFLFVEGTAAPETGASVEKTAGKPSKLKKHLDGTSYYVADGVVMFFDKNDDDSKEIPVCQAFEVVDMARDEKRNGWSLRIKFEDYDGVTHVHSISKGDLEKRTNDVRPRLADAGFKIFNGNKFEALLKLLEPKERTLLVTKPGWLPGKRAFVCPDGIMLGALSGEGVHLDNALSGQCGGTLEGQLAAWDIALRLGGSHHLVGCLGGVAGALVQYAELDSTPIVTLSGPSSTGKTTGMKFAAGVWGYPDFPKGGSKGGLLHSLRSTPNAVEFLAERSNGTFLGLDETAHGDASTKLEELIFMLAGGNGKHRMKADASERVIKAWLTFAMLSSEHPLAKLVERMGRSARIGFTARVADIDVSKATPIPHDDYLRMTALLSANFGWIGPKFVEHLIQSQWSPETVRAAIDAKTIALAGEDASSLVSRSAGVFAVLWQVGEMLATFGLLPASFGAGDVARRLRELWEGYKEGETAEALAPATKAIETLRETLYARMGRDVHARGSAADRNKFAETVAWYEPPEEAAESDRDPDWMASVFYVRTDKLAELAGDAISANVLCGELAAVGMIGRAPDGKFSFRRVRGVGLVRHYILDFGKVGESAG